MLVTRDSLGTLTGGGRVQRAGQTLRKMPLVAKKHSGRSAYSAHPKRGTLMDTPACPTCGAPMIERRRRADGAPFLGCSRFPACRGIRSADSSSVDATSTVPQPPLPPARSDGAATAGASAATEFERRMVKHADSLPARKRRARLIGAGFVGVGLVVWLLLPAFWMSAGVLAFLGLVIAVAAPPIAQSTQSWATGAEGEVATAALLDPLVPLGAVVLHDRRIPGSRANVDHIVVSPGGVFVVETKSYKYEVGSRNGVLTTGGRRTGAVAEVRREAAAVERVVDRPVIPLIVVHRARVSVRTVDGIRVLRPSELQAAITGHPAVLSPAEVSELAARIDKAMPRAALRQPARSA